MKIERYINEDGKVGVLHSCSYCNAWSTHWTMEKHSEFLMFDKGLIERYLNEKTDDLEDYIYEKIGIFPYKDDFFGLDVLWLNPGQKFTVMEFDGWEAIITENDLKFVA